MFQASRGTLAEQLTIAPEGFILRGADARQRLIVTDSLAGRAVDVSGKVTFVSENPEIARVDQSGIVTLVADGQATVAAIFGNERIVTSVQVVDTQKIVPVNFQLDVMPVLSARGCNMGACHGKARGQNGFQLSLLGFDADFDYDALTKNARGRRVFPAAAEKSLLLLKGTAQLPHGGGERLKHGGSDYQTLLR